MLLQFLYGGHYDWSADLLGRWSTEISSQDQKSRFSWPGKSKTHVALALRFYQTSSYQHFILTVWDLVLTRCEFYFWPSDLLLSWISLWVRWDSADLPCPISVGSWKLELAPTNCILHIPSMQWIFWLCNVLWCCSIWVTGLICYFTSMVASLLISNFFNQCVSFMILYHVKYNFLGRL